MRIFSPEKPQQRCHFSLPRKRDTQEVWQTLPCLWPVLFKTWRETPLGIRVQLQKAQVLGPSICQTAEGSAVPSVFDCSLQRLNQKKSLLKNVQLSSSNKVIQTCAIDQQSNHLLHSTGECLTQRRTSSFNKKSLLYITHTNFSWRYRPARQWVSFSSTTNVFQSSLQAHSIQSRK